MRILVVEDETKAAAFIRNALQAEGFVVEVCPAGDAALALCQTNLYDALVLDIMLPGLDGMSVLRELRRQGRQTPVLLLSARGEVNERVAGLNAGADDYLPKPFELAELVARLRALVRRSGEIGPRRPDQGIRSWIEAAQGDRTRASLVHRSAVDEVADPYGHSFVRYQETAAELDRLTALLAGALWPDEVRHSA